MIITIDGPMASGKSTIARRLAYDLGYTHLNSGLLYRALAYVLLYKYGCDIHELSAPDPNLVQAIMDEDILKYQYDAEQGGRVYYSSLDITQHLKMPTIDQAASIIAAQQFIRDILLTFQRSLSSTYDLIADGRDCGTVVFPDAEHKFFITADRLVRAKRWLEEQRQRGNEYTLEEVLRTLDERDARDSERASAPLRTPAGSHAIDTSHMTIDDVMVVIKGKIA